MYFAKAADKEDLGNDKEDLGNNGSEDDMDINEHDKKSSLKLIQVTAHPRLVRRC